MLRLLIILLLTPLFTIAQQYSEVIEIPNKTSDQLYRISKEWFAITFKSANDVIQLDDPIEKKIIGKGIKQVNWTENLNVHFTLIVQFKDNKYKYDIQATEIKIYGGAIYSYDELKGVGTENGLMAEYHEIGIKSIRVNNKSFQERLALNKLAVVKVECTLHGIVNELTSYLKKEDALNNW